MTEGWPSFSTTSDKELEHLKEYARRIVDTKFKCKLKEAISDFYKFRKDGEIEMIQTIFQCVMYIMSQKIGMEYI